MLARFQAKKRNIVAELSRPLQDYADDSPKGSVDEALRPLIDEINRHASYVTTSSCSGRVTVFLEGPPKQSNPHPDHESSEDAVASAGGKGGGEWLFTSHEPVSLQSLEESESLYRHLGLAYDVRPSFPSADSRPQFVHLKFEPMILHILTASPRDAQAALTAALAAGFRESGLTSLLDRRDQSTPPMVAIRTMGLAFDTVVAFRDPQTGRIVPMVDEAYLKVMLRVANERFAVNGERIARLKHALLGAKESERKGDGDCVDGWEDKEQRRERKRREGLARRDLKKDTNTEKAGHDVDVIADSHPAMES